MGGICTLPDRRTDAIQVHRIWLRLGSMKPISISLCGFGWVIIMVRASAVCGPHLLKCG